MKPVLLVFLFFIYSCISFGSNPQLGLINELNSFRLSDVDLGGLTKIIADGHPSILTSEGGSIIGYFKGRTLVYAQASYMGDAIEVWAFIKIKEGGIWLVNYFIYYYKIPLSICRNQIAEKTVDYRLILDKWKVTFQTNKDDDTAAVRLAAQSQLSMNFLIAAERTAYEKSNNHPRTSQTAQE
jgi:hypothetical protein